MNNNQLEIGDENEVELLEFLLYWIAFLILPVGFFIFGIWAFTYGSKNEIVSAIAIWIFNAIAYPILYKKELSKIRLKKKASGQ